jgi:deazaflavin-dependent oxidoreductase (nitroreductase family)
MTGNDFVAFLLRSPLYFLLGNTMLLTVTGRKTGRQYTTPVGYYRSGGDMWVITSRDRTWWRNLREGARVAMHIRGRDISGFADVILDEDAVTARVEEYLRYVPMAARPLGVRVENGKPHPEDAARLGRERLFVKITPD